MIRSSTDDNDPFVAMVQTAGNSLVFEYRTTTGGSVTASRSAACRSVPNTSRSSATAITSAATIVPTAQAGRNSARRSPSRPCRPPPTSGWPPPPMYNPQLTAAVFNKRQRRRALRPHRRHPRRGESQSRHRNHHRPKRPRVGKRQRCRTDLHLVLHRPTGVTYTGNTNGTNAAKNITAIFTQAGNYNFTATITDPGNNNSYQQHGLGRP